MKNLKAKTILFCAGGTGGHIFPAIAVANEVSKIGHNAILITDKRSKAYLAGKYDLPFSNIIEIYSASPYGNIFSKIKSSCKIIFGIIQAIWIITRLKPDRIIAFGGYPAFPALFAAKLLRKDYMIHEQNAVLGRVNRYFAKNAWKIFTGFANTQKISAEIAKGVLINTGNPIRAEFFAHRDNEKHDYNNQDGLFNILLIGGSQGARYLSELLPKAITELKLMKNGDKILSDIAYTIQARADDIESLHAELSNLDIAEDRLIIKSFFSDINTLMMKADMIISRAGASSLAEIAAMGCPAVIVPLPSSMDNHQLYNAQNLQADNANSNEQDGVMIIEQGDDASGQLADAIMALYEDADLRNKYSAAVGKYAKPNAAADIMNEMEL